MSKDSRVRDWTGPYAFFTAPFLMFITNQFDAPKDLEGIFSNKKRFSLPEIIPLMMLWGYDDFATARGFQHTSHLGFEGNPVYSGFAIWMVENGYSKTETSAIRTLGFYNQALILLHNYTFGFNTLSKFVLYATGIAKLRAGRPWDFRENDFTWKQLFSFEDGIRTPWVWSEKD
jgi:hypothetical protein